MWWRERGRDRRWKYLEMGGLAKRELICFADTAHSKHFLSFSLPLVPLVENPARQMTKWSKREREIVVLGVIAAKARTRISSR
ncbi:hypothetical protein HRI_001159800 [Hibiscus trionum]|uniref:Uncharacterized protein n=1 Tax=Hibiscus trionum TaxID=183268 RepID=A0A9W7HFM7_HIBTR|nr:hypothetical protein HRI_001159800 [Hibiscus trionum]